MDSPLQRELNLPPARALAAVRQAAELWGAEWRPEGQRGRLVLPVAQGLRRGVVEGQLRADATAEGTRLTLEIETQRLSLNRSAVAILVLGALGGLTTVFWPLSPSILRLAPVGAVLALVAWLLVVSRLRSSGAEDFLELVDGIADGNLGTPSER